jgi:hypothetical protein
MFCTEIIRCLFWGPHEAHEFTAWAEGWMFHLVMCKETAGLWTVNYVCIRSYKRNTYKVVRRFGTASRSCLQWSKQPKIVEDGTYRVPLNIGNYRSTLRNIADEPRPPYTPRREAWDHAVGNAWKVLGVVEKSSFVRRSECLGCAVSLARSEDLLHINSCCCCCIVK